jgi:hypothetical protein
MAETEQTEKDRPSEKDQRADAIHPAQESRRVPLSRLAEGVNAGAVGAVDTPDPAAAQAPVAGGHVELDPETARLAEAHAQVEAERRANPAIS